MAQFDVLLVILEPHIKKKTTNFCEFSVQGSFQCCVLRDEVDELYNRQNACWMQKTKKIECDPNLFMTDEGFGGSV